MGIDKGLGSGQPIAIVDGEVFQYGEVAYDQGTFEPLKPEDRYWLVEHFSYAKHSLSGGSEQEVRDFLDALPESHTYIDRTYPGKKWHNLTSEERSRILAEDLPEYIRKTAIEKRKNKKKRQPEEFVDEVRHAIIAVIQKKLVPFCKWDNPEIEEQIDLIIADALRRYQAKLQPADPLPKDYDKVELEPAVIHVESERCQKLDIVDKALQDFWKSSPERNADADDESF